MDDIEPIEALALPEDEPRRTPLEQAHEMVRAIEAIVMVADRPVEPGLLAQLLEIPAVRVEELAEALAQSYAEAGHGFQLVRVAGGYRFQSHPELSAYVERFVLDGQSSRLSAAALETLAIVAYKQPISRAQVAAIRGVDPDGVMRTLQQRGYIETVGRDGGPGQALLYATTTTFLERLGLDSLDGLPPLAAFVPGADVVEALEQTLRPEGRPPRHADTPAEDLAPGEAHLDPAQGVAESEPDVTVDEDRAEAEPEPEVDFEDTVVEYRAEVEPEPEDTVEAEQGPEPDIEDRVDGAAVGDELELADGAADVGDELELADADADAGNGHGHGHEPEFGNGYGLRA